MKVEKNGIIYEIKNPIQIVAFLESGYVEVKETKVNTKKK